MDAEQKVVVLHSEISASSESAGDNRAALVALQSELVPLLDDITALGQHLCATAGIQINSPAVGSAVRSSTGLYKSFVLNRVYIEDF